MKSPALSRESTGRPGRYPTHGATHKTAAAFCLLFSLCAGALAQPPAFAGGDAALLYGQEGGALSVAPEPGALATAAAASADVRRAGTRTRARES